MRATIVAILMSLALCACSAPVWYVNHMSAFQPAQDGRSFTYRETANQLISDGSIPGESGRVERMEEYLRVNRMCSDGYVVREKKVISHPSPDKESRMQRTIIYFGECR